MSAVPPLMVPAGIDSESARAITALLNARFDALPIERVLVWHLPSVQEDALPHLADTLGVDIPYVDAPPRDALAAGVAFLRGRGVGGAMRRVLEAFDVGDVALDRATALRRDGTIRYDGLYRHGAENHWAVFFVRIALAAPIDVETIRALWDAVTFMSARRDRAVLYLHTVDGATAVFRAAADIEQLGGLGGDLPLSLGG